MSVRSFHSIIPKVFAKKYISLNFSRTTHPMMIKITPFDAPCRDESNDIIYIKLFQEMVVMQALLMESKVS